MSRFASRRGAIAALLALAAAGCASRRAPVGEPPAGYLEVSDPAKANEVVLFSLGLLDVGYRFGGRNPDAGLDCSGMVSWIYEQVAGVRLPHNAAEIAKLTRPIERARLRPGDLVFFDTRQHPYSHVGIFVGGERFVHAPNRGGRVQASLLSERYYASRFSAARTLFAV